MAISKHCVGTEKRGPPRGVGAIAFKADRWTRVVAGVFLIAAGVAVFMAKPITVETITSIGGASVALIKDWLPDCCRRVRSSQIDEAPLRIQYQKVAWPEIRCASVERCNLRESVRRLLIPHSLQPRRRDHDGGQLLAAQPVLLDKVDKSHDDFALARRKS